MPFILQRKQRRISAEHWISWGSAIYELPYDGAKEMLLVEDVDSKEYLAGLFNAMYDELPVHKSNNKIMKF